MTTNDVRDILNIKINTEPRPSKKAPKQRGQQNDGLSKELANLLGERVPPVVLQSSDHYKKRFIVTRKAQPWAWQAFDNPCRKDGLKLRHWVKKTSQPSVPSTPAEIKVDEVKSGSESYYFARYNYPAAIPAYTDAQYEQHLQSKDWTKEETDYLFSLVRDYDLRWILIDDRYDFRPRTPTAGSDLQSALVVAVKPRAMEDLKVRYYQVAANIILLSQPQAQMTEAEFEVHERMTKFNPEREKRRKEIATTLMSRSPEEIKEEEILLAELRRIVANEEKFLEDRKELYDRLDHPIAQHDTATFQTSSGLQQLVQNLYYTDKNKKRRTITVGEASSPAQAISTPTTARDHRRDGLSSATVGKKKSNGPLIKRILAPAEEKRFGVSIHDRLNSGVSFRSSRVDKLILAKSQIQSAKLQDAVRELSIPLRPRMPTIAVCAEYEKLITSIHTLLDARKLSEKVANEIKIVKVQKGIGQEEEEENKEEEEEDASKMDEDADAEGEMDYGAENQVSTTRHDESDGDENQEDESKLEREEEEENEAEDREAGQNDDDDEDEEPTKVSIESDNEEADEDRPLMPGDADDEEDLEDDAEVASIASPESPPADEDDEDGEAEPEAEEEEEEENERPSSSRASVARSTRSARSGRSVAGTVGVNKHKRSASALSVSGSEKSAGTRSSKRARK